MKLLLKAIVAVVLVGCGDSAELAKLKEERKRLEDENKRLEDENKRLEDEAEKRADKQFEEAEKQLEEEVKRFKEEQKRLEEEAENKLKRMIDEKDDLEMEAEVLGDKLEVIASESIHAAAGIGYIENVKKHIADGTDVNTKDHLGRNPLHCVAFAQHLAWQAVVELLIAEGVGVNAKANNGETPLDTAIRVHKTQDRTPIMDLLRKHGAKTSKELEDAGWRDL